MSFDFKNYCENCYKDGKTRRKQIKIKDQYPLAIEKSYAKKLREEMLKITKQIKDLVQSELKRMPRRDSLDRTDAYIDQLNNFFDSLADKVKLPQTQEKWIKDFGENVNDWNTEKFTQNVYKELGVDFYLPQTPFSKDTVSGWVTANEKVTQRYLVDTVEQLRAEITKQYLKGVRAEEIEENLINPIATGNTINLTDKQVKMKAKLWARNEIGNLNGNLTKTRQQDLGIEKAQWITSGDERVRCTHRLLDGKIYPIATGVTKEWASKNDVKLQCTAQVSVKQKDGSFKVKTQSGDLGKEIDTFSSGNMGLFPSESFNCRCVSVSVIDLEDIEEVTQPAVLKSKEIDNMTDEQVLEVYSLDEKSFTPTDLYDDKKSKYKKPTASEIAYLRQLLKAK